MTNPIKLIEQCKYQEATKLLNTQIAEHSKKINELQTLLHICAQGIGGEHKWDYYYLRPYALGRKQLLVKIFNLKEWQNKATLSNILVPAEEGLGDELLYTTYLHLLEKKANIIYVECDPRLKPIFERSYNPNKFVFFERGMDNLKKYAPKCQYFILSSELTYRLNPEFTPNLTQPLKCFKIEDNLFIDRNNINIGISHHTLPKKKTNLSNSWLDAVIQLFPDYLFINLQNDDLPCATRIGGVDLFENIELLAALIDKMKTVITISNTIAHLAGRLHKKCLLITPMNCNTRWLMTDIKNYYPKTTHIRGDWDYVQKQIIKELEKL